MVKRHLKRFATPTTWQIKKKGIKFITKPNPGAHPRNMCLPLNVVLKMIGCANTTKEAKKLIYANEVLVDGKRVKDTRFPVGFMDVISITLTKEDYRITFNTKGKLIALPIDAKEAKIKISQISGKTLLKGAKVQLNLADSRNIIIDKDDFVVGSSILIDLPSQKITSQFKLEKGASVLLIGGKHISEQGTVENVEGNKIIFKNSNGDSVTTSKKYAFVIGKEKPAIKVK